jgi:hypothetical protein
MALFTPDTHFVVFMNAKDPAPSQELHSREALGPVFADLNHATGEAYCLAHHVSIIGGERRLMVASLRYLDTVLKVDENWLFAERKLYVDWIDERAFS